MPNNQPPSGPEDPFVPASRVARSPRTTAVEPVETLVENPLSEEQRNAVNWLQTAVSQLQSEELESKWKDIMEGVFFEGPKDPLMIEQTLIVAAVQEFIRLMAFELMKKCREEGSDKMAMTAAFEDFGKNIKDLFKTQGNQSNPHRQVLAGSIHNMLEAYQYALATALNAHTEIDDLTAESRAAAGEFCDEGS
jgi:hypothetical protein